MSFKGKVVLVTGASSGIGAAIAVAFAKEGADVVMVGRNETKLAAVEKICASHGKPPLVIKADLTKDDDVTRVIEATVEKFGKLHVLVNNAGMLHPGNITDGKLTKAFDKVIAINLRAPMKLTSLALPYLIKTKGNIINMSGIGGQCIPNIPDVLAHCVSKAALNHFTLGAALELSAHGVRVNAVSPGPVYTELLQNASRIANWKEFTTLKRVSEPEEIADLVFFLASDKAKAITGSNYVSDNGSLLKR